MAAGPLELQVLGLAGDLVAAARLPSTSTVRDLKQYLCDAQKLPLFGQQLMIGTRVAEDSDVLSSLPVPLNFTLVVMAFNAEVGPQLLKGAQYGRHREVEDALHAHADPNFTDSRGSALFQAARGGHVEVARRLLEVGADRDGAMQSGATALHAAAQMGHADVARLLCEAGVDKEKSLQDGTTPLFLAAQGGHLEVVQLLCDARAEVNRCRQHGATPLLIAALYDREKVVRFLSAAGADRGRCLQDGTSALHVAALNGNSELARFLEEAGGASAESPQRLAGKLGFAMSRWKCPHRQRRSSGLPQELDP